MVVIIAFFYRLGTYSNKMRTNTARLQELQYCLARAKRDGIQQEITRCIEELQQAEQRMQQGQMP